MRHPTTIFLIAVALFCLAQIGSSNSDNLSEDEYDHFDVGSMDAKAWNSYAAQCFDLGYYYEALKSFNTSIVADPHYPDPWNNKGVLFAHLGDLPSAMASYDRALQIDPENSVVWSNRGLAFYMMGKNQDALDSFNRSIEFDSKNSKAWNNKGVVYARKKNLEEAQYCFSEAKEADLYCSEAWNNEGVLYAERGYLEQALDHLNNAVTLNPNLTEAWFNGGLLLRAMGDETKSKTAFDRAESLGYNQSGKNYIFASIRPEILEGSESQNSAGTPGFEALLALPAILLTRRMKEKRDNQNHILQSQRFCRSGHKI